ncbi:MAG: S9 family peptidase [Acidobacteriota bacterium]|nr:S9 family peptidase [Acidobacteriota bacterium]
MTAVCSVTVDAGTAVRGLEYNDIFDVQFATDPQISPDGRSVIFVRNYFDIMTDRRRSELWISDLDGNIEPLLPGTTTTDASSPRWSPDGKRVAFVSTDSNGKSQLFSYWINSGKIGRLTSFTESPTGITWSPDGTMMMFFMRVAEQQKPLAKMPSPPKGAKWSEPAKVVTRLKYRSDGSGFLPHGFTHLFAVSSNGGAATQITSGDFNHGGRIAWSQDHRSVFISANRSPNWEYEPANSEVYKITLGSNTISPLTDRFGPDSNPSISDDGKLIAYNSYEDKLMGYHNSGIRVMDTNGGGTRDLTANLDRSAGAPEWNEALKSWLFTYSDIGDTKLAAVDNNGVIKTLAVGLGSNGNGRPYLGGESFTASKNGTIAYTIGASHRPGDVALRTANGRTKVLTNLNEFLMATGKFGEVTEVKYKSSFDGREIQGWYMTPPGFDPKKKHPLILEIHGGPFAAYGPRFSSELQLMASKGYVILYTNPRGSTSYGAEFANQIHHKYPGNDYDDLMSGVDAMIEKGFIDEESLFVTGGSGGGVLTAWIVGKTDRFKAAVVAKPVINWFSFSLTADNAAFYSKYWFSAPPWEKPEEYYKRSPISLVGNVKTPTMLLTGEDDLRTPIPESEQFYQALKMRKIDTAMVRIPGSSHGIAAKPSNLIAKVAHILAWFEKYGGEKIGNR